MFFETLQKPPSKQLGHSLRKSFRCVPDKRGESTVPRVVDRPTTPLNLQHIVPPVHPPATLTRSTGAYPLTAGQIGGHQTAFAPGYVVGQFLYRFANYFNVQRLHKKILSYRITEMRLFIFVLNVLHRPMGAADGSLPRELYSSMDSMVEPLTSFMSDEFSPDEEHSLIARFSRRLGEASPASTRRAQSAANFYGTAVHKPSSTVSTRFCCRRFYSFKQVTAKLT